MAKFKPYNYDQMVMISITLKEQLEPGNLRICHPRISRAENRPVGFRKQLQKRRHRRLPLSTQKSY